MKRRRNGSTRHPKKWDLPRIRKGGGAHIWETRSPMIDGNPTQFTEGSNLRKRIITGMTSLGDCYETQMDRICKETPDMEMKRKTALAVYLIGIVHIVWKNNAGQKSKESELSAAIEATIKFLERGLHEKGWGQLKERYTRIINMLSELASETERVLIFHDYEEGIARTISELPLQMTAHMQFRFYEKLILETRNKMTDGGTVDFAEIKDRIMNDQTLHETDKKRLNKMIES